MTKSRSEDGEILELLVGMDEKLDRALGRLDGFLARPPLPAPDILARLLDECRALLLEAQDVDDEAARRPLVAIPADRRDELIGRLTAVLGPCRFARL